MASKELDVYVYVYVYVYVIELEVNDYVLHIPESYKRLNRIVL